MTRKRLTREDGRDRTTQRLLAAARKLIARRGLSDTTLEDIAEEAGYTRGALYSNFNGKGDLFIELLRRDREAMTAQLRALRDDSLQLTQIRERLHEILGQMYRTNESFMNWAEARMLAARDPRFRAKLDGMLLQRHEEVANLIQYVCGRLRIAAPLTPTAVAMGFNSLLEGLKLNMLSRPGDMTSEDAEAVLAFFVDSLLHMARLHGAGKPARGTGELQESAP